MGVIIMLDKNKMINILNENTNKAYASYIENFIPDRENFIFGTPAFEFLYTNENSSCMAIFKHKLRSNQVPFYYIVLYSKNVDMGKVLEKIPQNSMFQIISHKEINFESPMIQEKFIEHTFVLYVNDIKLFKSKLKEQYKIINLSDNLDKYDNIINKCEDKAVLNQWNNFKSDNSAKIYAIIENQNLVCYCDLIGDYISRGIGYIYTSPLYRNKGFASMLLNEIILYNKNLNKIEYVVKDNNVYSQKVANNNGFKKNLTVYLYEGTKAQ
jgi:GNAT superfamily N-acetyltransferase